MASPSHQLTRPLTSFPLSSIHTTHALKQTCTQEKLAKPSADHFLKGWAVYPAFTAFGRNGVPPKPDLKLIVECAGGRFLDKPTPLQREKQVLVLSDEASLGHKTVGKNVSESGRLFVHAMSSNHPAAAAPRWGMHQHM